MNRQGLDGETLERHFGVANGLMPMWIAEPEIPPPPAVVEALRRRADEAWFGYETRPDSIVETWRAFASARHGWDTEGLRIAVSPSVGTSIGVIVDLLTEPGDGVIIQPPVFTDFKPLITANGRTAARNPLVFEQGHYRLDLDGLAEVAADPANLLLILCSPHNPVGRVWSEEELLAIATICGDHDVTVLADEIHADLALAPHRFTPFAAVSRGCRWVATHGPIKTFGLAGVCDTLLVTDDEEIADRFDEVSSRFHLTRNNVFALAAFEAAYRFGADWLDGFLEHIHRNLDVLAQGLPDAVRLIAPEATYMAWLDLRALGLDVPEIGPWLAREAGLAVSPGHWFGREGAGFARLTIAAPTETIERAVTQLAAAVERGA